MPTPLPYLTAGIFALALLLFLVSFRQFRRSRFDTMWRKRREAGQRGLRLFILGVLMLLISSGTCVITAVVAIRDEDESPTQAAQTLTPSSETALAPSNTPEFPPITDESMTGESDVPTITPSPVVILITTTPAPSPTGSVFPTFTPNVTPLVSSVTPQANARLQITALDDQISDTYTPVNPRTEFNSTTTRIYYFVEFNHMAQGSVWKMTLSRDGEIVEGNSYLWRDDESGETYFFFGNDSGFAPGNYEIRLFIGENSAPTSIERFIVTTD
jgi:hypothetical protein